MCSLVAASCTTPGVAWYLTTRQFLVYVLGGHEKTDSASFFSFSSPLREDNINGQLPVSYRYPLGNRIPTRSRPERQTPSKDQDSADSSQSGNRLLKDIVVPWKAGNCVTSDYTRHVHLSDPSTNATISLISRKDGNCVTSKYPANPLPLTR